MGVVVPSGLRHQIQFVSIDVEKGVSRSKTCMIPLLARFCRYFDMYPSSSHPRGVIEVETGSWMEGLSFSFDVQTKFNITVLISLRAGHFSYGYRF